MSILTILFSLLTGGPESREPVIETRAVDVQTVDRRKTTARKKR